MAAKYIEEVFVLVLHEFFGLSTNPVDNYVSNPLNITIAGAYSLHL